MYAKFTHLDCGFCRNETEFEQGEFRVIVEATDVGVRVARGVATTTVVRVAAIVVRVATIVAVRGVVGRVARVAVVVRVVEAALLEEALRV